MLRRKENIDDHLINNPPDANQSPIPSGRDVIDPRIDVRAQFALLRLFKAPPPDSTDAIDLFSDVKSGRIQGIFGDDLQASVKLAHARGVERWELVPPDRDSINLDDGLPDTPTIIFKEAASKKPRLDAALLSAYREEDKNLGIPSIARTSSDNVTRELQKQKHIVNQKRVYNIIKDGLKDTGVSFASLTLRNSCEWIDQGEVDFTVLTRTHDAFTRVPRFIAYFDPLVKYPDEGGDYPLSSSESSPHITFKSFGTGADTSQEKNLTRFFDPEDLNDDEVRQNIVHEVQHDASQTSAGQPWIVDGGQDLNRYESEFRSRWLGALQLRNGLVSPQNPSQISEDKLGSPLNPATNERVIIDKSSEFNVQTTSFQNERQENIFWDIVDNGYEFVKRAYIHSSKFRERVDDYSLPIGGNFINSVRIQAVSRALTHSNQKMARNSAEVNFVFEEVDKMDKGDSQYLRDETLTKPFWDQARRSLSSQIFEEFRADIISS